jgi:hypothetical protein
VKTRIWMGMIVMAGVVAMGSLGAGGAKAQTALRGEFHLDHAVRWSDTSFLPGDYTLELESVGQPAHLVVASADAKKRVFLMAGSISDAEHAATELQLAEQNGEWVVEALNLPQLGIELRFARLGDKNRSELAKKNTGVTTAGK